MTKHRKPRMTFPSVDSVVAEYEAECEGAKKEGFGRFWSCLAPAQVARIDIKALVDARDFIEGYRSLDLGLYNLSPISHLSVAIGSSERGILGILEAKKIQMKAKDARATYLYRWLYPAEIK